ncbi:hypothetical protein JHK87_035429 [Glycine soja]|nr:hypothetical protein JHK87_035429 [Glycine soja]
MALHLSTALSFVCREEEKNMVLEFCKGCIEHQKAGNLYIYRFPETGKSLSMEKVKDKLLDWAKEQPEFWLISGRELGFQFEVYRNDELTVELKSKNPKGVLISLGLVLELGPTMPLFGVCMAFGGECISSYHFQSFLAGRYHGLVIDKDSFPDDELEVTASTKDGLIMTARHKKYKHLRLRSIPYV